MNVQKAKPLFRHAEFQAEYSLAQELPYWDFFEDQNPPCIVLSDGSMVQGMRLCGVSIETWDENQVNQLTLSLRSFLNALPDSADLQFFVDVNSDFKELISDHEAVQGENSLIAWVGESRITSLREAISRGSLQRIHLFIFVYQRVASSQNKVASFFSKPTQFLQARKSEFETRAHTLSQLCISIQESLKSAGIESKTLPMQETLSLIYKVLNPKRFSEHPLPKLNTEHKNQEFTPEELKSQPALTLGSPREQLVLSDLIQGVDGFFLDGHYHRILTLKTLPEFTYSALISRLTSLPFHFSLSVQIQVPDQSKELSALQSKRRMAHSMSASHQGRVTDLESEAKLQSTEEILRELINTGQKIFYFQTALLIKDESPEGLELKCKMALSRIREMNGAEGIAETVAGFKVFKTLLPAGNTISVRAKRAKTDNLADFLPVYQSWEGNGRPVCLLQNRASGLLAYDPFDPKLPNYNCLVTGSSGSGKSFLNNCILLQYLSQKPLIYIIDIGGSYRKLCEFMNGQYIEMIPPKNGETALSINPFLLPPGNLEPSPQKIKFLLALLETLLTDEDGEKLPKLDKSLLEEAILLTYVKAKPGQSPRLSDFTKTLTESPDETLRNYARMLYPWTGSRPYGRLLDDENSLELNSEMVVFDLKGLSSYPDLQAVMILIITDFILSKVEGIPGRQKRILMDECWDLLKSRGASQFMEYCARTLRKSGSGITFITQGLEEIERNAIGSAILNNTATKFILMQRGDLEPTRKILKLNDQEIALISSLRQNKGIFSEAFLVANESRSVVRITPTPLEYWLATSDAADNALLMQARARFPEKSLPEVIHYLAQNFPMGSQGLTALPAMSGEDAGKGNR